MQSQTTQASEKKPYASPTLTELGSIAQATQQVGTDGSGPPVINPA